jgi:DNA-binding beta-propeller fold protein YncE
LPVLVAILATGFVVDRTARLGKQADGSYVVSTGLRVEGGAVSFRGRPSDLALHPKVAHLVAVLNKGAVFLIRDGKIVDGSSVNLGSDATFHGLKWTPNGERLIAGTSKGYLQSFDFADGKLTKGAQIKLTDKDENPVPGGFDITRNGRTLYVAAVNLNAVVQVDLASNAVVRRYPVAMLPYEAKLSEDEQTLVVSNWGGRIPLPGDRTGATDKLKIVVTEFGAPASGTVSLINLATAETKELPVGIHPSGIEVVGKKAYVANAMSDSISEIDLGRAKVTRTIGLRYGKLNLLGSVPSDLQARGNTLYVASGGDNALAEIDLGSGRVKGFRPAGYFPVTVALDGDLAVVLNSKGNGSVANTAYGRAGNAHDFEGTVSFVPLTNDLAKDTQVVAKNNRWDVGMTKPKLAVYNGAIQHVLYIIKENRTYDEVMGDMKEGNGDAKLAHLGNLVMPNHQALAREFTLFDNGYVTGTNSADGHTWADQAIASDYLERFYVGYTRSYPDDGDDSMSISPRGCIWDAALRKGKTIRMYGEYANDDTAEYKPRAPKDWFEAWDDRIKGTKKFTYIAHASLPYLQKYMNPNYHYWPLIQSDQARADEFIREYTEFSKKNTVPNLMVMSLPSDHSEGGSRDYPTPSSMMADNDLALGRIVEAVSKSPQWKNTCIFVIEDDAQAGPDHVDGHRTPYFVISPYNKRHVTDSNLYTNTNMLRSIGLMLGLDPLTRFDQYAQPIDSCFNETPDLTPYTHVPNRVPLGSPNPGRTAKAMTPAQKYWQAKSDSLDWSHIDGANSYWLNRIIWASTHPDGTPFPARAGESPVDAD